MVNIMSIPSTLTALCDMLRAHTGVNVVLGRPEDSTSTIYVWPWLLEEAPESHNLPPAVVPNEIRVPQSSRQNIHFLVIATPALTIEGLSRLAQARQAILENPVLNIGEVSVQVMTSNLEAETLASVFQAAGIPLTICVSAMVRGAR
jgi:hypothetical protein